MFDRTDRSHIGVWWWTVDKMMLASIFLLMVLGAVLVMAASPPVASRIGLPDQHFVWRQLIFLMPATAIMLITSILSARLIRILCLLGFVFISGNDCHCSYRPEAGNMADYCWLSLQPSNSSSLCVL